jgi:hypothetical protein
MLRHTLLVMLMLGAASPARASNWAEELFEELTFDFGAVPRGLMLTHPFRIVNNTKTPVHIASVRVSSSPLTARALQHTLAPGEETAVIVQMDSRLFAGQKAVTIYVSFDSPRSEEVMLTVHASSRDNLVFAPASLDLEKIKRGATATAEMTMAFLGKPKIQVTEAKCDSRFIQAKLLELSRNADEVVYLVSANLQGDLPEGKWYTDVWVTTNDTAMPKVRVPLIVEVEPPLLDVRISGPKEALVDQPITFHVEVRNKGTRATDKDLSLIVQTGTGVDSLRPSVMPVDSQPGMDFILDLPIKRYPPNTCNGLHRSIAEIQSWQHCNQFHLGTIKPDETSKRTFALTPKQAKMLQLAVHPGVWNSGSGKNGTMTAGSNFSTTSVHVKYDPNTLLDALLPQLPQSTKSLKGLPQTLAEVPEVFFQKPLTKKITTPVAQLHIARLIDRIQFLNGKKTDAFMEALIGKRPDLAGLPFVLGDDCRMKVEDSRQFAAALGGIREAQPQPASMPVSPGPAPQTGFRPGPSIALGSLGNSQWMEAYQALPSQSNLHASARVASLMQVLGPESAVDRQGLAKYLAGEAHVAATRALAKLAIFSEEPQVRTAAINGLKKRSDKDYSDILLNGLNYPWPAVAQHSSEAIVQLGRNELIPQLIGVLAQPDPRAPLVREVAGKKATVVREVVRLNHLHNCLLCHAPATADPSMTPQDKDHFTKLTAQVPVPSESLTAYYRPSNPDILVRLDVTYLRQDFSMNLPVRNAGTATITVDADPWPEMQRYDYLVRTREITDSEADTLRQLLQPKEPQMLSAYQLAAHSALRELTGLDAEPTAAAWTTALRKLPSP